MRFMQFRAKDCYSLALSKLEKVIHLQKAYSESHSENNKELWGEDESFFQVDGLDTVIIFAISI